MTDSVPEKLDKYKIIEEVGRGGFAAVYKAVDTTLDRTVALKVLAPHLLWDPTFVQRFQREAKVAANLDHPNIVTIHEVSQVEGVYFIAMQFLEGQTVSQILEAEGPLPISRVQAIIEQIASALNYAHARGFVHRDVKPSNIIVADDGRATLTDFGLVKAGEGTKLSTTGVVFGTPEYMSPEQAEGKKLDARSDVYSLGVVLFEMLAGRAPFLADTTPAVMYKHVHEPPPLDELPSDLPQGAVAMVEKALAKDPADRYQSAGQMVEALRKAAAEAPVPAEIAPPPPTAVIVEEKTVEAAPPRPEPEVAPPLLVEPVAVLEKEAVPFWQKVPLWGWGVIGGLILLAVVGGALLAGGGLKGKPIAVSTTRTPLPLTDTPTPTHPPTPMVHSSEDFSYSSGATYYPKAQSFVFREAVQIHSVALHMQQAYSGRWKVRIISSLPNLGGERGLVNHGDLDNKTLGSAEVSNSSAGWVDFHFPSPILLEPGQTYYLFIDSYDLGDLGPDSIWSQSASGSQPGPYPDGTGWVFVYSWSDNSNYKPTFEKHFDYAFRIYFTTP
jgi:serine/threonine protein kinase